MYTHKIHTLLCVYVCARARVTLYNTMLCAKSHATSITLLVLSVVGLYIQLPLTSPLPKN